MSFDCYSQTWRESPKVSIPFDQGNVFRQPSRHSCSSPKSVSIPFDQGNVFRRLDRYLGETKTVKSQSLSIRAMSFDTYSKTTYKTRHVSIPFEQGDVFRPRKQLRAQVILSQSLSNRAMFFDSVDSLARTTVGCLNPFRTGRCFSTFAVMTKDGLPMSQSLSNRAMFFDFKN